MIDSRRQELYERLAKLARRVEVAKDPEGALARELVGLLDEFYADDSPAEPPSAAHREPSPTEGNPRPRTRP